MRLGVFTIAIGLLLFIRLPAAAQMQLVFLKHERVMLRLNPGDEFIYRLKNSKDVRRSYVNNLSDTAITVHNTVVPFNTIERVYFSNKKLHNTIGGGLVVGGIALFLIDQLNHTAVRRGFSLDRGVSTVSIAMIAVGIPLVLLKKKSQKVNYPYRLMTARAGSPFYQEALNHAFTP